jgi:hypothetical protein
MDVSNAVDVSSPDAVCTAVSAILLHRYPRFELAPVECLFHDFGRLYAGEFPGFHACDIGYHNAQHVLDVTLAIARLLDGYEVATPDAPLGPDLALVGIATSLFHDSGYIRRKGDSRAGNGAAYTRVHVARGARFLAEYLPGAGLGHIVEPCTRIIHFTGYDTDTRELAVSGKSEHLLGTLLGTADLIAQMADIEYVRKCREHLYEEFVAGGMAGEQGVRSGHTGTIYRSPEQLLRMTPGFIRSTISDRLDGEFNSVHRYAAEHFEGRNLYLDAIRENCSNLELMLAVEAT